jgi:hypothetical protein
LESNYGAVPTALPEAAAAKPETESAPGGQTANATPAPQESGAVAGWHDFIDDGVEHHFVAQGETLGKIANERYHRASLATDVAWANQIDNPNRITSGQEILLPLQASNIPPAPKGWPETSATSEEIARRGDLLHANRPTAGGPALIAPAGPVGDPSAETAAPPQAPANELSPAICETQIHTVQANEKMIWDVSQKEYGIQEFFLGIKLAKVNHWVAFSLLMPGQDLVIPCLREIRPDLATLIAIFAVSSEEVSSEKEADRR